MQNKKSPTRFSPELPKLAAAWREDNNYTLEQAKAQLGISKSYISMLENNEARFLDRVFFAYHRADPERFQLELAGQLPLDGGSDEN